MGWTVGVLGFVCRRGLWIFLFTTASRTALGPTQPPIELVPGALSLGLKRPGREANHSPPRHENLLGSGRIAPRILSLGTWWMRVVSLTPRPLHPQGENLWYPLDRRLGGTQSRCWCSGEEENPFTVPAGNRIPVVQPLAQSLYCVQW
jgi:hypothetical protein